VARILKLVLELADGLEVALQDVWVNRREVVITP